MNNPIEIMERIESLRNSIEIKSNEVLFADFCFERDNYLEILPLPKSNHCTNCGECDKHEL